MTILDDSLIPFGINWIPQMESTPVKIFFFGFEEGVSTSDLDFDWIRKVSIEDQLKHPAMWTKH